VPGNAVDNSDTLKALSKAVADSVGKPEQASERFEVVGGGALLWSAAFIGAQFAWLALHFLLTSPPHDPPDTTRSG